MRFIDWKELKKLVPYSRVHIGRLEKRQEFPKRVQLGPHRTAWVENEVKEWMQALADQRNHPAP